MKWLFYFSCVLLWLVPICEAYKILFFIPTFGISHIRFSGHLADILADAGHEVHVYQPIVDHSINVTGFTPSKVAKTFTLPKNEGDYPTFSLNDNTFWTGISFDFITNLGQCKADVCKAVLNDKKNLDLIRAENYDLLVTEYFEPCGYGIKEATGITKYVTTWSGGLNHGLTSILGVKTHLSYSPESKLTEKMGFVDRINNIFDYLIETNLIAPAIYSPIEKVIQSHYPDFKLKTTIAESAFIFINSEEHVDYTIPVTPKLVRIPNIDNDKPKPLTGEIAKIVESPKTRGIVLFSFGSVVKSCDMPSHVKTAFLEAFAEFPDITFFWKYEKPEDGTAANVPNVFPNKWLPQRDLLYHPKMLAFITHGGQNSLNEAAAAGVPLLSLPLFADQPKNTALIEYRGLGLGLNRQTITKEKVVEALQEILNDKKYKEKAQLISRMIQARPLSTKESFIKHIEFAAEFGDSGTLSAEGANQSVFVLYSLDVIGVLLIVVILVVLLLKWVLFKLYNVVSSRVLKSKKD